MRLTTSLCTWVTLSVLATPLWAASFDCTKARSYSEKLICADAQLSLADEHLSQTYQAAKKATGNTPEFRAFVVANWKKREACQTLHCVREWFADSEAVYSKMVKDRAEASAPRGSHETTRPEPRTAAPLAEAITEEITRTAQPEPKAPTPEEAREAAIQACFGDFPVEGVELERTVDWFVAGGNDGNHRPEAGWVYPTSDYAKVLQSTSKGVLVILRGGNPIFVETTNTYPDNVFFRSWVKYTGDVYRYEALSGAMKTVYRFKEMPASFEQVVKCLQPYRNSVRSPK